MRGDGEAEVSRGEAVKVQAWVVSNGVRVGSTMSWDRGSMPKVLMGC